jgi:DNA-binding NarL/FixJ family response regulator
MKVLLAEDDRVVRITVRDALVRGGFAVTECADGTSAAQAATQELFDLVLNRRASPRYGAIPFGKTARWGLMPLSWVIGELAPARSADPAFTPVPSWVRADTARTVPAVTVQGATPA